MIVKINVINTNTYYIKSHLYRMIKKTNTPCHTLLLKQNDYNILYIQDFEEVFFFFLGLDNTSQV